MKAHNLYLHLGFISYLSENPSPILAESQPNHESQPHRPVPLHPSLRDCCRPLSDHPWLFIISQTLPRSLSQSTGQPADCCTPHTNMHTTPRPTLRHIHVAPSTSVWWRRSAAERGVLNGWRRDTARCAVATPDGQCSQRGRLVKASKISVTPV